MTHEAHGAEPHDTYDSVAIRLLEIGRAGTGSYDLLEVEK